LLIHLLIILFFDIIFISLILFSSLHFPFADYAAFATLDIARAMLPLFAFIFFAAIDA